MRFGCAAAFYLSALAAHAAPADDLKALVEQGKSAEAYAAAKNNPAEFGDPAFDFFFGVAAIESGHAGDGVLALERYLLNFPDNVSARLQLARGYFLLGEDARAREEFEALRQLKPPAEVSTTIERFLDAIRLRETRYTTSAGGYIELGIGNDSNVNGGVASPNIFLANLRPVTISQAGQKLNDNLATLGAGGYVSHPIAAGISLFANGQAEQKQLSQDNNRQYQMGNLDMVGGISILRERNLYKFSLNQGYITLGNRTYRTGSGGAADWKFQLSETQTFGLGVQGAQLRYTDPNTVRDADFWGGTANYRQQFNVRWQPALSVSINAGQQHSKQGRFDLVPRTAGANVGVSFTPAPKWGGSLDYVYLQSNYRGPDVIIGDTRRDNYHAFIGGVTYLITRNLSAKAEVQLARNQSNIDLYSFPRDVYMVKLRYEFK
jgi:hypothetical protein